jgi:hypothetical protein
VLEDGVPTSITEAEFHFEALRAREKSQLRALGAPGGKSLIVPLGAMGRNTRELTVAASGWVGSQPLESPGILDWSCVRQAGATFFSGLREDLIAWHTDNFPISTWLPEVGLVVPSNPTTIASRLTPKRIATSVIYSRQLFVQASIAIDDYVTKTIARVLNAKLDAACLYGAGGIEPLGILNTPGVNNFTFPAAGPGVSWGGLVEMRRLCLDRDVFPDSYAMISSPNVEAALALDEAWASSGPSAWHSIQYPQFYSKEVFDDRIFSGVFNYLVVGLWNGTPERPGLDLIIDPFSLAINSQVIITANLWCDCAVTWPEAFAFSQPNPIVLTNRKDKKTSAK